MIDEHITDPFERRILQLQHERERALAGTAVWAYAAARLHGLLLESTTDEALLQRAQAIVEQVSVPDGSQQLLAVVSAAERLVAAVPQLQAGAIFLSSAWQEFVEAVQRHRGEDAPKDRAR